MTNIKISILSGIPGSGKSTWVENQLKDKTAVIKRDGFAKKYMNKREVVGVVSADYWFMHPDGEYRFYPGGLDTAHGTCLRGFLDCLRCDFDFEDMEEGHIIVDNTNTTVLEIAPYMAIANAHEVPVTLHTFKCDPKVGAERNKHGVPLDACFRMAGNIERREFPPFWRFHHFIHHSD